MKSLLSFVLLILPNDAQNAFKKQQHPRQRQEQQQPPNQEKK